MAAHWLNQILGGVSGAGQGIAAQQDYRLKREQAQQASQLHTAQMGNIASQVADRDLSNQRESQKRQALVQNWQRAQAGDPEAQAQIVSVVPEMASFFQAKPKTNTRHYDPERGVVVDPDAGTFAPIPGLPAKAASPRNIDPLSPQGIAAQIALANAKGGGATNPKVAARTDKLRASYMKNPDVEAGYDIAQSITGLRSAAADKTPAGDLAFIFRYMKMLDPKSVVREGEFNQVEKSQSIPDRIKVLAKKVSTGGRLSDSQRMQFLAHAEQIAQGQRGRVNNAMKQYGGMSRRQGVDSADVAIDPYEGMQFQGQYSPNNPFAPKH